MSAGQPRSHHEEPIRIGVSACLLGHQVRFDGGHKHNLHLMELFGHLVDWVPVCPEVELGMCIPRESVRLERDAAGLHLFAPQSGRDWTQPMRNFAARRVRSLAGLDLSGYVLKKDSPSCGMERVRVYPRKRGRHRPRRVGRGFFAETLIAANPLLPVEEDGRLGDPRLRENFVARVFAYQRLRAFFAGRWTLAGMAAFHAAHKFTLLAHSPVAYPRLGRLVARAKDMRRSELRARYETEFMGALSRPATKRRHTQVLKCMARYCENHSQAKLLRLIGRYQRGLIPRIVPLVRIRQHVQSHKIGDLEGQTYLEPRPEELLFRSHT